MNFLAWLKLQTGRDDMIGDVAIDIVDGSDKNGGLMSWLGILVQSGFMSRHKLFSIQFMTAYNLYKSEVGHGDIEVECFFQ